MQSELDRRTFLRTSGRGGIAAGLAAAGFSPVGFSAPPIAMATTPAFQAAGCSPLIAFEKRTTEIRSQAERCKNCGSDANLTSLGSHGFDATLTEIGCDETSLPASPLAGTMTLSATLSRRYRQDPCRCPGWIGVHEGTFALFLDGGRDPIFSGEIIGADGMTPTGPDGGLTCHPEVSEGMLVGKGLGRFTGWRLIASYWGRMVNPELGQLPCELGDWDGWSLTLGGIFADLNEARPDLVPIAERSASFCQLDNGRLVVTVANQGSTDAGPSITQIDFLGFGTTTVTTPALSPSASVNLLVAIPVECWASADCNFRVTVDATNAVDETDEANNVVEGVCIG